MKANWCGSALFLVSFVILVFLQVSHGEEEKGDWIKAPSEEEQEFVKHSFNKTFPQGQCNHLGYEQFEWVGSNGAHFESVRNLENKIFYPKAQTHVDIIVLQMRAMAPDSKKYISFAPMAGTKTFLVLRNEGNDMFSAVTGYRYYKSKHIEWDYFPVIKRSLFVEKDFATALTMYQSEKYPKKQGHVSPDYLDKCGRPIPFGYNATYSGGLETDDDFVQYLIQLLNLQCEVPFQQKTCKKFIQNLFATGMVTHGKGLNISVNLEHPFFNVTSNFKANHLEDVVSSVYIQALAKTFNETNIMNKNKTYPKSWKFMPKKLTPKTQTMFRFFMNGLLLATRNEFINHVLKITKRLMETAHQYVEDLIIKADEIPHSIIRRNDKNMAFNILCFMQVEFDSILKHKKLKDLEEAFAKFYKDFNPIVEKFVEEYKGKNALNLNWYSHLMHVTPEQQSPVSKIL